jgi:hypothetical protein
MREAILLLFSRIFAHTVFDTQRRAHLTFMLTAAFDGRAHAVFAIVTCALGNEVTLTLFASNP